MKCYASCFPKGTNAMLLPSTGKIRILRIFVLETDSIASNNGSWKLFFHAITVQVGLGPETQLVPAGCGASIQAFIVLTCRARKPRRRHGTALFPRSVTRERLHDGVRCSYTISVLARSCGVT